MRLPSFMFAEFSYMTAKATYSHFIIPELRMIPKNKEEKKNLSRIIVSGVSMPSRIGHNYMPLRILNWTDLGNKYSKHRRLRVFHHKGLNCEYCSKVSAYLIECMSNSGSIHIDVYTDEFELMTIDHVIPKSKGGSDELENLVPCCNKCNRLKSDKSLTYFMNSSP